MSYIRIGGTLAPLADSDDYSTTDEAFHRGGYQTVADIAGRDSIPSARLKRGSHVRTEQDGKFWRLVQEVPPTWVEVDLEAVQAGSLAQSAQTTATAAQTASTQALASASTALEAANAADSKADAAIAAAASFPIDKFRGNILTLGQDPGDPAVYPGYWWQIGVTGTLTHPFSSGHTVTIGDRLLGTGTAWEKYLQSPNYLPDSSIGRQKMDSEASRIYGRDDSFTDYLRLVLTSTNQIGYGLKTDGTFVAKLPISVTTSNGLVFTRQPDGSYEMNLGTVEGELPIGDDGGKVKNDPAFGNYIFAVHDSTLKSPLNITSDGVVHIHALDAPAVGGGSEIEDARGTRSDLDERLDVSLDEYGVLKGGSVGTEHLREAHKRLACLAIGEADQLSIAIIGDSWTQARFRYVEPLNDCLRELFGRAGAGWVGFGYLAGTGANDNADTTAVIVTSRTGKFTSTATTYYGATSSPDICAVWSDVAGEKVACYMNELFGEATSVILHYGKVAGGGTFRYRFGTGSWTTIDTNGAAASAQLSLAGVPASGNWLLEIEVLTPSTAGVLLYGVDLQHTQTGVRVHKLGSSGSRASHWAAANATQWQAGLTSLAPNLCIVCLGTNDQGFYDVPTFSGHMQTLINRILAARPSTDILLMAPCENGLARPRPMSTYASEMRKLAYVNRVAFLDLQNSFGLTPADYAFSSARPWMAADQIHPTADGGRAILAALLRALEVQSVRPESALLSSPP